MRPTCEWCGAYVSDSMYCQSCEKEKEKLQAYEEVAALRAEFLQLQKVEATLRKIEVPPGEPGSEAVLSSVPRSVSTVGMCINPTSESDWDGRPIPGEVSPASVQLGDKAWVLCSDGQFRRAECAKLSWVRTSRMDKRGWVFDDNATRWVFQSRATLTDPYAVTQQEEDEAIESIRRANDRG